ncbi:MAG: DUF115 domain-containing protein [Spirochaetaceae bacterium]|nr:MAG: DUF115 domain-containing protein [Spirochaetaceae bacterium]
MTTDSPSVVPTTDGPTVVYRGRNLYSPATPITACRRRVAALTIPDHSLVLVPSPLLGHGLTDLLHKCGPGCRVLLVELEAPLAALARQRLPAALLDDSRVTFCAAERVQELERCFPLELRSRCERVISVNLSAGSQLHSREYTQLLHWLQDEIRRAWQNRITTIHMARLWFRNLIANLPLLPVSRPITGVAVERPVLVLGAGPSLEPLLAELRRQRDQLFVMAVDTALPVLVAHGITVDAVVALEPQHANLGDFLGVDCRAPLLLADLFSYPAVVRLFTPHHTLFFASHPLDSRLIDKLQAHGLMPLQIPPLGSVGVAAVKLATCIYGGPVAFAGLDFAYADGKTHARGAPMLQRQHQTARRLSGDRIYTACLARPRLRQPDKQGGRCQTDMVLLSYAEQLRSLTTGSPRLYDLGVCGLPTGAPRLDGIAEFLRVAGTSQIGAASGLSCRLRATSVSATTAASHAAARQQTATVRAALDEQLSLLARIEEQVTNRAARDPQILSALLQAADYLYAETSAPSAGDEASLRRMLAAARYYRIQIGRALRNLERLTARRF